MPSRAGDRAPRRHTQERVLFCTQDALTDLKSCGNAPSSGLLANPSQTDPWILTLDVGTSSVRTLIFDARGRQAEELGAQIPYHVASTSMADLRSKPTTSSSYASRRSRAFTRS